MTLRVPEDSMRCVYRPGGGLEQCLKTATIHLSREGATPATATYFGESFCSERHLRKYLKAEGQERP